MSESNNPWEALEAAVEQGRRYARRANHFEERALDAEARIKAVYELLDENPAAYATVYSHNIRRALDGS